MIDSLIASETATSVSWCVNSSIKAYSSACFREYIIPYLTGKQIQSLLVFKNPSSKKLRSGLNRDRSFGVAIVSSS